MSESSANTRVLRLDRITKRFGSTAALDTVSFEVHPSEVHALCGENGAGKSTLMKVLAGVWPHGSYEGCILDCTEGEPERELQFPDVNGAAAAGIAIVHQELVLMQEMSVLDNLFLGRERHTRTGALDRARQVEIARAHFQRLELDLPFNALVRDLGVGQQQRLEIARALLSKPSVLVLDEPTSALPEHDARNLLKWIRGLADGGTGCVYISHRMEEVFTIADRITVLRDGRAIWTRLAADTSPPEVIEAMVARPPTDIYAHTPLPPGDVVCEIRDAKVVRHHRTILDVPHLAVRRGEIVGLAGMMGAGRTCLLRLLAGALNDVRVSGSVRAPGDAPGQAPCMPTTPHEAVRRGMFLIPEDRKQQALFLDEDLVVNVTNATVPRYRSGLFLDTGSMRVTCEERMGAFAVKAQGPGTVVKTLSGGNQQKVLLCRAAEVAPKLLLLDEPTRGIDVGAKEDIYRQMEKWTRAGWTILWSSSEMQELLGISDRVYVLANGKVTGEFTERPFKEKEVMAGAAVA